MFWIVLGAAALILFLVLCALHLWMVTWSDGLIGSDYDRCRHAYEEYLWDHPWPRMSYFEFEREYRKPRIGPGVLPKVTPFR